MAIHGKPQSPHGQHNGGITFYVSSTPGHCCQGSVHFFQVFFHFFSYFFSFFPNFQALFHIFRPYFRFSGLISAFQALFLIFRPNFHVFSFFFSVFFWIFRPYFFVSGLISGFQALFLIFGLCWFTGIMPVVQCPRLHCTIRPSVWFAAIGVCSKR